MDNAGRYRLAANKLLYVTDQPGTFQTVPFAVMPIAGNAPVVTTGGLQKFTTGSAQLNSTVNANGHTVTIFFEWDASVATICLQPAGLVPVGIILT